MSNTNANMLVFKSNWYGKDSFRMMPVTEDCPFLEVIFDPSTMVLAVIGKSMKDKPQMLPKLNNKGQTVQVKGLEGPGGLAEERFIFESYYEYYVDEPADIKDFVKRFAINPEHEAVTTAFKLLDKKDEKVEEEKEA